MAYRGYVNRTRADLSLQGGGADLWPEELPPEVHDVLRFTESRVAGDMIKKIEDFLLPVPRGGGDTDQFEEEPAVIAAQRRTVPLALGGSRLPASIPFGATPAEEEDVVGLFHELIGWGCVDSSDRCTSSAPGVTTASWTTTRRRSRRKSKPCCRAFQQGTCDADRASSSSSSRAIV